MKAKVIRLDNGGILIYEHTKLCSSSAFEIGFRVGAYSERKAGTAHFLEHTLFKKTQTRTNAEVDADRNKIAYMNASTSMDFLVVKFYRTNKLLAQSLDFAYDILMNSVIDDEFLETEKGVIKEELAMCLDNESRDVYNKNYKQALSHIKTASDIVGKTPENIDKINFKDLLDYKRKNFIGNNFVCSVISSLSLSKIKRLVDKKFVDKIAYNPDYKIKKSYYETNNIDKKGSLKIYVNKQEKVSVLLSFKIDADEMEIFGKNYNYTFIAKYLSGSQGKLFLKLRNKGLVYRLDADISCFKNNSLFNILFETSKEKIKEILNIIADEIKNLVTTDVTEEYINTFKNNLDYYSDEKLPSKPSSKSYLNLSDYLSFGKVFELSKKQKKQLKDGVNAKEVRRIANNIFNKNGKMYVTSLGNATKKYIPSFEELKDKFMIGEDYEKK